MADQPYELPSAEKAPKDALGENPGCIVQQLANDHDVLKGLYKQYKSPSLDDEQRQRVIWQMVRAMCVHLYAEEEVLCPVMAEEMGENVRDHSLDVDQSLKLLLSDIDSMKVGQEGFTAKIEQLMEVFYEHMSEEEHTMAEMRDALGEDRLMELGTKFKAAKDHVPTRPHPAAPDSLLVHIAMAPIDYIRDRMRGVEATAA